MAVALLGSEANMVVSPGARRLAEEHGINLSNFEASFVDVDAVNLRAVMGL